MCAQNWAEEGSLWYYSQSKYFPFERDVYHKIESTGDAIIGKKKCQRLIWKTISRLDSTEQEVFTYESNDSIFFYEPFLDTFHLIYRFNAEPGDTIESEYIGGRFKYWIDSTKEVVLLNGDTTVIQYISNAPSTDYLYFISEPVIVGIGALGWLLPNSHTADPPTGGGLNCYYRNGARLYSTSQKCRTITNTPDLNTMLNLAPNPTSNIVRIETDEQIGKIEILGLGSRVANLRGSKTIELPESPGLYIIRMVINGMTYEFKVVKLGY